MAGQGRAEVVNPVPVEEVDPWTRSMATTFIQNPGGDSVQGWVDQLRRRWQPERTLGVKDRGRWVATMRTEPRQLTVPSPPGGGAELAVDALTNVTVAATHRRQGFMSRMLASSLAAARDRGEVLSVLIAAEWPIYGRFGYAPATLTADYVLQRHRPGSGCDGDLSSLRQTELAEIGGVAAEVFARARGRWAGQMDRTQDWWDRSLGLAGVTAVETVSPNWLVHEGVDGVDGILGWTPEGEPSLLTRQPRVVVDTMVTASEAAYRDLWAYLTALDGIDHVKLAGRPADEPIRWLLDDARALVKEREVDFLWLRFLDVAAALRGRTYAAPGEVVLEIVDPDTGGFAAGRYRLLVGEDGRGECDVTDIPADVEVNQRALASSYLGGFRLAELALTGGVRELRRGALTRLDLMLSTARVPWNPTWF